MMVLASKVENTGIGGCTIEREWVRERFA